VVAGHLSLAVVDRGPHGLRGANLLTLRPGWVWVAALAPMPVFFAAAGWANATADLASASGRLRSLVGLGAVVVGVWSVAALLALAVTADGGVVADGARLATQPMWFLAAYVPFTAFGRRLARLATAHVVVAVGGALGALTVIDVARFGLGAHRWIGWPAFFVAWGVPWLLGAWWRSRWERGARDERRVGAVLLLVAVVAATALVRYAHYQPALIDTDSARRSNTTPPTLYTAIVAVAQVGVQLLAAGALDRLARRFRRLWDRAGEAAVAVYAWHLTALVLCVGVVAAGLPVPRRLTGAWWATRPIWWTAVLAVAAGLVALTAAARSRLRRFPPAAEARWPLAGVVLAAAGAALVGVEGPRAVWSAVACGTLFATAWWSLRPRAPRRSARARGNQRVERGMCR
jgi:hypothetical protein